MSRSRRSKVRAKRKRSRVNSSPKPRARRPSRARVRANQTKKKSLQTKQKSSASRSTNRSSPKHARATVVFVVLHIALCLALFTPQMHTGGDNATYMLLADAVLTPGEGYGTSIDPGPPVPHTKYPPGYPVLLAVVKLVFGQSVIAFKALSLVLTTLSVLFFCQFTRHQFRGGVWIAMCGAYALNPIIVEYSHWVLSEAAFLVAVLGTLYALDGDDDGKDGLGKWFWLGLIGAVLCFYVRQIGALLLVAATVSYLARRSWRKAIVFGGLGAALTLPWLVRSRLLSGEATPYLEEFLLRSVYQPELGHLDFWGFLTRILGNLETYVFRELPRVIAAPVHWRESWLMTGVCALAAFLILVGLARALRRWRAMEIFFLLSVLAALLFEEVVADVRYLVPLVPLMFIYSGKALEHGRRVISWVRRPVKRMLPVTLFTGIAAVGLVSQTAMMPARLDVLTRVRAGDAYAGYHPSWRGFFQASEWATANTPPDAVFTVRKPRLFHFLTGRRALIYPFTTDTDSLFAHIETTDYVLFAPVSGITSEYLAGALDANPDRWQVEYDTEGPLPSYVIRVLK